MKLNEERLVKRAKKGDQQAFAEIVGLYKDKLYNVAFRMMGNRQEAEDVVQETFLRVYANLRQYDPSYKFSTWLYKIATNFCIDRLRKKKTDESLDEENLDYEGHTLYAKLSSSELTPEEQLMQNEMQYEVQAAISQLQPLYRAVILLRYIHDLSLQEIADILEIPVSTVKTRIHRGREALKKIFEALMEQSNSKRKSRNV